jgi:hypothetical protein
MWKTLLWSYKTFYLISYRISVITLQNILYSYPVGTRGSSLGHDADHSPPSSAKVKNEYELYFLSPSAPAWWVTEQIYLLYYITLYDKD